MTKQQIAQALGPQVGVNAAGDDDAAMPASAQQVEAALYKQLVEIDVATRLLAAHHGALVFELGRCAKPLA